MLKVHVVAAKIDQGQVNLGRGICLRALNGSILQTDRICPRDDEEPLLSLSGF